MICATAPPSTEPATVDVVGRQPDGGGFVGGTGIGVSIRAVSPARRAAVNYLRPPYVTE